MKFSYADLISGDDLYFPNIGHIRQPRLSDLQPTHGIGIERYHLYLNVVAWEKDDIVQILRTTLNKRLRALDNDSKLNEFDLLMLLSGELHDMALESLSFFIIEHLIWDEQSRKILVLDDSNNAIGEINRENFKSLREAILQVNYIDIGKSAQPTKYTSKKAEEAWNRVQNYLKEESKRDNKDKRMELGNLISKLCMASPSYNLLNVYQLTIFQFYDQFFQCGYIRAMNLQSDIYSTYGGKDFDLDGWMKPLINN